MFLYNSAIFLWNLCAMLKILITEIFSMYIKNGLTKR